MFEKRDFKSPEYIKLRKTVYRRDSYACQMPGCSNKKLLNCHHTKLWAKFPSLRYNPDFCITLCRGCHKKVTGEEEKWEELFLRIIAKKQRRNPEIARYLATGRMNKEII